MQEATALPGNEAALRVAIDEVIPRSLAEAGVEVFPAARGPRKSEPLRALRTFRQLGRSRLSLRVVHFKKVVDAVTPLVDAVTPLVGGGKPDTQSSSN